MARVTEAEVKEIIDTPLTDGQITPFIQTAHIMIEQRLAIADEALLKEIERWLAAHFVAIRTPTLKLQTIDGVTDNYHVGVLGKALESTPYGQQAVLLDPTGRLAKSGSRPASVEHLS